MRVTIAALGFELDLTFGPVTVEEEAPIIGGETGTTWLGFTARHDVPEEVPYQPHTPAWDEPDDRGL